MKGTRAALRYAKATLDLAKEKGLAKEINDDMLLIDQTISENKDLDSMLKSPIIKSSVKKTVLTEIFGNKTNAITHRLFSLLIENKRLPLLPVVAKEFIIIYDKFRGVEVAHVTTAIPLTKELEAKILIKIKEFTNNKINLKNTIDASIIGGFILTVGDQQYDSSVAGQLHNLLTTFEKNQYTAKI